METFRTVFYTPIYVTVAGGFLESEGLAVDFSTTPAQFPHPRLYFVQKIFGRSKV